MHRLIMLALLAALGSGAAQHAFGAQKGGSKRARISGIVVAQDGNSIAGARVQVTGEGISETVTTDRDGAFRFSKLKNGSYVVTAFVFLPGPPPVFVPDLIGTEEVILDPGTRAQITVVALPV